ncbi:MAG: hypothetical protein HFH87_00545 [Lachnospiraceae bacterium]|nr:hypothetical protein [Lachnospiraceae bacterium]
MDEIRLKISNPINMTYKKILLRKFFYMVFISADGKKLDVYIATVFGGITQDITELDKIYSSVQHDPQDACSLEFAFFTPENDGKLIEKVSFTNLTDSFCQQPQWIGKVWGACESYTDQKSIAELLKKTYPSLYPSGKGEANIDMNASPKIYYIKKGDKPSHICIADKGRYEDVSEPSRHRYAYKLYNQNKGKKIDGLEIMNWIKADITLSSNILKEPVLFSVELEQGKIITPDFTWYFAPPAGYVVSENSSVRIGEKGMAKEEKNAIQGVMDETTVLFSEWDKSPLSIKERKKSRVLFKAAPVKDIDNLSEDTVLAVALYMTSPQEPTNRQFWIGLIIAFLLSFCSDKTRINDYYSCLKLSCTCVENACFCEYVCNALSILSPILLLCTFFTFIMSPQKCFPPDAPKWTVCFKVCRICGFVFTALLMVYVFGLWFLVPVWLISFISCRLNIWILGLLFFLAAIANIVYLIYCLGKLKRKIFNCL